MKYYIIAGEASGDLHASKLIRELSAQDSQAQFRIWGGDRMQKAAGVSVQRHLKELSYMGVTEVIRHLPKILSNFRFGKADILYWQPDVLICVDFPGFNLRMAKWASKKGISVYYYIAPQVWAWKENRIRKIKAYIDHLFVILPFEESYFRNKGIEHVHYFGHPLKDEVPQQPSLPSLHESPIIALLPGSRKQEIQKLLPLYVELAKRKTDMKFIIVAAPGIDPLYYEQILRSYQAGNNITVDNSGSKSLLPKVDAACVASGTATLETALYGIPMVVTYITSRLTYQLAKWVIKVPYISLVNLIAQGPIVKELIQQDCNIQSLEKELHSLLYDERRRQQLSQDYQKISAKLGEAGSTERMAKCMIELLRL